MVSACGGTGLAPCHWVCQKLFGSPSIAFEAGACSPTSSSLSADAVQPVRASTAPVASRRLNSATDVHGLPFCSDRAWSRTYRAVNAVSLVVAKACAVGAALVRFPVATAGAAATAAVAPSLACPPPQPASSAVKSQAAHHPQRNQSGMAACAFRVLNGIGVVPSVAADGRLGRG